jgi:hypothetical protein
MDTLCILETALQHPQHGIRLQIHNQHAASRKYSKSALPQTGILTLHHAERLCLKRMPWPASLHRIICDVGDGFN